MQGPVKEAVLQNELYYRGYNLHNGVCALIMGKKGSFKDSLRSILQVDTSAVRRNGAGKAKRYRDVARLFYPHNLPSLAPRTPDHPSSVSVDR